MSALLLYSSVFLEITEIAVAVTMRTEAASMKNPITVASGIVLINIKGDMGIAPHASSIR